MLLSLLGLPIQVRDTGLAVKEDIPRSDVNKEYYTQNMEREVQCPSSYLLAQVSWVMFLNMLFFGSGELMLVSLCVLRWPTLMAHDLWASWVKHPALVTCC